MQKKLVVILLGIFSSFSMHLCAADTISSDEENVPAINRCLEQLCCGDEIQILRYCGNGAEDQNSEPLSWRAFNVLYGLAQLPTAVCSCFCYSGWQSFLSFTHGPNPDRIFAPRTCCDDRCQIYPFGFDGANSWMRSATPDDPMGTLEFDRFEGNPTRSDQHYELVRCRNFSECMASFIASFHE